MTIKFKRIFDPLFYFKEWYILVDGCLFDKKNTNNEIHLPKGTYLIQTKILPNYTSNTLMVNELDDGKTILIYSGITRGIMITAVFILWLICIIGRISSDLNIFDLPLVLLSSILLVTYFILTKNTHSAIKIKIKVS